jgi:hypothetical protein
MLVSPCRISEDDREEAGTVASHLEVLLEQI